MMQQVIKFMRDEEGATAVEYGLIVGLIAAVLIAVLTTLGGSTGLQGLFQAVSTKVTAATASVSGG